VPLAGLSEEFRGAATTVGRKLGYAMYYKEVGRSLTSEHYIWTAPVHLTNSMARPLGDYLARMLPNQTIGMRRNIKDYGRRFGYKSGYKEEEDFIIAACQFGAGFLVITITARRGRRGVTSRATKFTRILDPPAVASPVSQPSSA
jgi:hypothetical protein